MHVASLSHFSTLCRNGETLDREESCSAVELLFDPLISDEEKVAFLSAQTERGLRGRELVDFASHLLRRSEPVPFQGRWKDREIFDCCGTGGGGLNLVNVSTGIVFILAAAGIPVVKHGNRGVTKRSGSADVLEALGVKIELDSAQLADSLGELGWGFIFAPRYHPTFRVIAGVRKILAATGKPSIFNYLGPLLNPVRPAAQLIGVFDRQLLGLYDQALQEMGCSRRCLVYAEDPGLGPLGEACFNSSFTHEPASLQLDWREALTPEMTEEFSSGGSGAPGTLPCSKELFVAGAAESAARLESFYKGEKTHQGRGLLLANAAVAMTLYGRTSTLREGVELARELIASKAAYKLLQNSRRWAQSQK